MAPNNIPQKKGGVKSKQRFLSVTAQAQPSAQPLPDEVRLGPQPGRANRLERGLLSLQSRRLTAGSARGSRRPSLAGSWGRTRCCKTSSRIFKKPVSDSDSKPQRQWVTAWGQRGGANKWLPLDSSPLSGASAHGQYWLENKPRFVRLSLDKAQPAPSSHGSCLVLPLYYHFLNWHWRGRKECVHLPGRRGCRKNQVCFRGTTWHKRCFSKHPQPGLPPFNAIPLPS